MVEVVETRDGLLSFGEEGCSSVPRSQSHHANVHERPTAGILFGDNTHQGSVAYTD
jgi:hypothetical protein